MGIKKQLQAYLRENGEESFRDSCTIRYYVSSNDPVDLLDSITGLRECRIYKTRAVDCWIYSVTIKGAWLVGWDT